MSQSTAGWTRCWLDSGSRHAACAAARTASSYTYSYFIIYATHGTKSWTAGVVQSTMPPHSNCVKASAWFLQHQKSRTRFMRRLGVRATVHPASDGVPAHIPMRHAYGALTYPQVRHLRSHTSDSEEKPKNGIIVVRRLASLLAWAVFASPSDCQSAAHACRASSCQADLDPCETAYHCPPFAPGTLQLLQMAEAAPGERCMQPSRYICFVLYIRSVCAGGDVVISAHMQYANLHAVQARWATPRLQLCRWVHVPRVHMRH